MKNKIIILTTIFVFSILASCTKEKTELLNEDENKPASFDDYYNFLQEETTAKIVITNFGDGTIFQTSIIGNRKPLQLTLNDKSYSFDEWQYNEVQNISNTMIGDLAYNSVFGNNFDIIVSGTDFNAKSGTTADGIYIPKLIEVEFANLNDGKVTIGTTISWNVDKNNANGVVALVHYTPFAQTSESIKEDNPEPIRSGFTFIDNGTYTITAEDLSYFPDNAWIEFEVGRAGYGITTNEDGTEDYSLAAVTSKPFSFQIKK